MEKEEFKIRDLIANHPEILGNEFELIQKEAMISDDKQIKIDVLLWDTIQNRPAIVEVKKDELNSTFEKSRTAIGQVLQYRAYFGMINGNDRLYSLLRNKGYLKDKGNIPIPRLIILAKKFDSDFILSCNLNNIEVRSYKTNDNYNVGELLEELKTKKSTTKINDEIRRQVVPKIVKKIKNFIDMNNLQWDHYYKTGVVQFEDIQFPDSELKWNIVEIFKDTEDDDHEFDEFVSIYCVTRKRYFKDEVSSLLQKELSSRKILNEKLKYDEGEILINKVFLFNSNFKILDEMFDIIKIVEKLYQERNPKK
tara:strand:+ start:683 stop:1609 length:927 start_codon:yes stop_codon:yes gene_type:complete